MRNSFLLTIVLLFAAAVITNVSCGSNSTTSNLQTRPTPPPTQTPSSASTTVPLAANTTLPIPALAGISATFQETTGAPAGSNVTLTSYVNAPPGAPVPMAMRHGSSQSSGTPDSAGRAIFIVSQVYSGAMTFASFPITKWQLPPSLAGSGPFELETIDVTVGLLLDTESATSESAGLVSFAGTAAPFPILAGHTYWWELVTAFPSPPPPGCGTSSASATLSSTGQNVAQPTLCNFTGSLTISPNSEPSGAGISVNVGADVPAASGSQGPPVPAGTTIGVISVALDVTETVTFNSGMFQFAVHFPSTIPLGGKSLFVSACTIESTNSFGHTTYDGCIDTPVTAQLKVAGQTASFAGLTSPLTLSGPHRTCTRKHCTDYDYHYTAAIYY